MADTSVIFNILAKDNASGVFDKVGSALGRIGERAAGFMAANVAMNGLSAAFGFAKDAVFGFNATLQNSQIAFTTMLGSGQKAQDFLTQLQAFAKATPFEFEGLVKNAQNMMGMGIAAKDVIPDLRALGDSVASVGGSAEQVDQVTLAFDQMAAKGTLDMGNMNQLLQGGVPNALRILADSYKVTTGQMIQMISTGKVQSADALPKLINGIEHGTKSVQALGGMMDKQSQTFTGALSNISDGLQQALAGAFRPFFTVASSGAQKLGAFFSSDTFSKFGDKVSAGISTALGWVKKFAAGVDPKPILSAFGSVRDVAMKDLLPAVKALAVTFGPLIKTAFTDAYHAVGPLVSTLRPLGALIKDVFGFVAQHKTLFQAIAVGIVAVVAAQKAWNIVIGTWTMLGRIATAVQVAWDAAMDANPIGAIILLIMGLVAAFVYLWTHSEAFRKFWIGLWNDIWGFLKGVGHWFSHDFVDFFVGAWHAITGGLDAAGKWITSRWDALVANVTSIPGRLAAVGSRMWNFVKDSFKDAVNWIIGRWNALHFGIPDIHAFGVTIPGFTLHVPQIPYLAAGGTATRGGLAMVGEQGAEVVSLPAGASVYPHGTMPAGGGPARMQLAGNLDGAFASALKQMVRTGQITFYDSTGQVVTVT